MSESDDDFAHEEEESIGRPSDDEDGDGSTGTINSSMASTGTCRSRRSKVWEHFEIHPEDDHVHIVCKFCETLYICTTDGLVRCTGTLKNHLVETHEIDTFEPPLVREATFAINDDISRRALVKFVVTCDLPLSIVEREGFVEFMSTIQPAFPNISRQTLKKYCFDIFREFKESLISHLSDLCCRVSLTVDVLTNNIKSKSYLVVSCYWIDEGWNLQKRILSLDRLDSESSGYDVYLFVLRVAKAFGIENKIMSITLDNASANDSAMEHLRESLRPILLDGELLHVRCVSQVINTCVKCSSDGALGNVIEKFKACGELLSQGRHRRDWKQLCVSSGVEYKKIPRVIETRWNYLYHLLSTLLRFKDLVTPFYNDLVAGDLLLTEPDWNVLTHFVSLLEFFKNATEKFSSIRRPTTSMFLPLIFDIFYKFLKLRENEHLRYYFSNMESEFLKYLDSVPLVHGLATLLDPSEGQIAFDVFFEHFDKFLGKNADDQKTSIMDCLRELYDLYEGEQVHVAPSKQLPETTERCIGGLTELNRRWLRVKEKSIAKTNSEKIQLYLDWQFESEGFDVLEWWRANARAHPVLATIARDVLAVRASSVAASDSAFSTCGRVVGEHRSDLSTATLCMVTCLKDWFAADDDGMNNRVDEAIDEFADFSSSEDDDDDILINRNVTLNSFDI